MPELCSRIRATVRGLDRYFTGKPCKNGHIAERRMDNRACVECFVSANRKRMKANYHRKVDSLGGHRNFVLERGFVWIKLEDGRYDKVGIKYPPPEKCENPFCENSKVEFEHDHVFMEHRGWLCGSCNKALGLLKENPDRIRWLAQYAEERCI